MRTAIIINDLINDIVHPEGLSNGCAAYVNKHNVIKNINQLLNIAREKKYLIIFINISFSSRILECSKSSLFYKQQHFKSLLSNTWGTQIHSDIKREKNDLLITKKRINPFFETNIDSILKSNNIKNLMIAGVSTELSVLAAAQSAHDKDYSTTIVCDACGSLNEEYHNASIKILKRFTSVITVNDFYYGNHDSEL